MFTNSSFALFNKVSEGYRSIEHYKYSCKLQAQGVEILVYMWVVDTTPDVTQEGSTTKVP